VPQFQFTVAYPLPDLSPVDGTGHGGGAQAEGGVVTGARVRAPRSNVRIPGGEESKLRRISLATGLDVPSGVIENENHRFSPQL
jgi:hypothetical protein